MNFQHYLQTRYPTACEMQRGIARDLQMIAMLREGPLDAALVSNWMREYGLFQGINMENREAVVNRFLLFVSDHHRFDQEPNADQIRALYTQLLQSLFREVSRSWISATSKLLWCLYPKSVVIYDAFVHRALVVLQCIERDLEGLPRIGARPTIRTNNADADITTAVAYYMNYQDMIRQLMSTHALLLKSLRTQHNEDYPYDVRIVDKVLWMIGNEAKAYPAQA